MEVNYTDKNCTPTNESLLCGVIPLPVHKVLDEMLMQLRQPPKDHPRANLMKCN